MATVVMVYTHVHVPGSHCCRSTALCWDDYLVSSLYVPPPHTHCLEIPEKETDEQTNRQIDRQTDRQMDGQMNRQTER